MTLALNTVKYHRGPKHLPARLLGGWYRCHLIGSLDVDIVLGKQDSSVYMQHNPGMPNANYCNITVSHA